VKYEKSNNTSVASFQIEKHWDTYKNKVTNDDHTKQLSNSLRSLQDAYFRVLHTLWENGHQRFICTLLSPKHAFDVVKLEGVDPSKLTFENAVITRKITPNRRSLFVRSIRIALASLCEYVSKEVVSRKLMRNDFEDNSKLIEKLIIDMSEQEYSPLDQLWASKIPSNSVNESLDEVIAELTESEDVPVQESDNAKFELLKSCLDLVGVNAKLELN
jgi:hypothetical protein